MSTTTTSPAEIEIPADLLATLRDETHREMEKAADALNDATHRLEGADDLEAAIEQMEHVIAARRALATDAAEYPCELVSLALGYTISEYESRIADDHPTVEQAEHWVRLVRECEALQATIERRRAS